MQPNISNPTATDFMFLNGIDATTGNYVLPPMKAREIATIVKGERLDPAEVKDLRRRLQANLPVLGVMEGVDTKKLEETGWGVIFAKDANPDIQEALKPLLDHRKCQAKQYYREYTGSTAYRAQESKRDFLTRLKVPSSGRVDPAKMPYYLLIVGGPESIPYSFQYQLDIAYAVGRICFDTIEEYEHYAQSVVSAETSQKKQERTAVFFGTRNADDWSTFYSATQLVEPLAKYVAEDQPTWTVRTVVGEDARKEQLGRLLGGSETPSLLFTASHGMRYPNGHDKQHSRQGALLCQDWPGRKQWQQPIPEDFYFAGEHVSDNARLAGLIAIHFACYSAGTPQRNDFRQFDDLHKQAGKPPVTENAPSAFVARLPQRLLSHPNGGALAVVGHVDRSWGYSFSDDDRYGKPMQIARLSNFQSMLKMLAGGEPVGAALEPFNETYAEIGSDWDHAREEMENGKVYEDWQIVAMWTAKNDARNFIIVGDPAVRL
jgi:hypothetical protein